MVVIKLEIILVVFKKRRVTFSFSKRFLHNKGSLLQTLQFNSGGLFCETPVYIPYLFKLMIFRSWQGNDLFISC